MKWLTKKVIIGFLVFIVLIIVGCMFFSGPRIAYIDSAKLMTGYNAMVNARKEYDSKGKTWQANIDSLTKDVQGAITTYEKTMALGTDKEKQLAKDLINTKQRQLQDYQSAIRKNAAEEEQRLTQNVLTTVNSFLQRYGKKHGYKMILVAANGNIAYADADLDITDKVVDELNKEYAVPAK